MTARSCPAAGPATSAKSDSTCATEIPIPIDEYSVRYCAFVDVLGFSGVIRELEKGNINHRQLRDILARVHKPTGTNFELSSRLDVRAQSISDAVCLSAPTTNAGLRDLFINLETLVMSLLGHGYLARGAIVRGRLYHDDEMVFGEALVEAYRLESTIARFPRTMLSKEVAEEARLFAEKDHTFGDFVRQADDGPFFLHALRMIDIISGDKEDRLGFLDIYKEYSRQLQKKFDAAGDDPRHFEKVQWFARYWNSVVPPYEGRVPDVQGPGLVAVIART